mgnify:CR=1 FL=1
MVPMLQRFYLVIAQLVKNGPGKLTRERLEQLCQKSAERLSMIYGLHSPDFFNKTLFHDFIKMLERHEVLRRKLGLARIDEEGVALAGALLDVMAERGFRYDTSKVGSLEWPGRTRGNLWEFPVQMFPRMRNTRSILGMDYNFKVNNVTGAEVEEMYDHVIERSYNGDRYPVFT